MPGSALPIDAVLDDIATALNDHGMLVLQAPPGAGKTTRVPLFLDDNDLSGGRILMLEPRRVATRTAAERMASSRGERVGQSVGFRMRGASEISNATRIEVITDGVLARMIQSDPELSGIGTLIFDEFHERALQADLGLAFALEIREALRPDLKIIVMSATLDAGPVADLLGGAPVVTSEGRSFPVETVFLKTPRRPKSRIETDTADLVTQAFAETTGGVLVFLPGQGEIARTQAALGRRLDADITPLYGALPFKAQMAALAPPAAGRRKIVLATSIAETSLTIPDVRVVVDAGRARRPRYDPRSGMTRLVTERVTKAEAEQRRGRAGRVAPGWCYRLWAKGEDGGMTPYPPVEIEDNDLASLALDLALWGADPATLPFLTPPPPGTYGRAVELLRLFGALDRSGITAHGKALAKLPMHPRLGQMVLRGRELGMETTAARLAALLSGRDPMGRGEVDVAKRIAAIASNTQEPRLREIRAEIKRLRPAPDKAKLTQGAVLSLAYPDRIGQRRPGGAARYLLSGGKGATLDRDDALAGSQWLAVADLDGDTREAEIRMAAPATLSELRDLHADQLTSGPICAWDARSEKVVSEDQTRLGALVLERKPNRTPDPEQALTAMLEGIRQMGLDALPWGKSTKQIMDRARWAGLTGMDRTVLEDETDDWLAPYLTGITSRADLSRVKLQDALEARIGWDGIETLNRLAPAQFRAPTGTGIAIDYTGDVPMIAVRLQEMLGTTSHPTVGAERVPVLVELLSPARRPIQRTRDLPGFWKTSYADVRKDMRGQYPKHVWPENPAEAAPTTRRK